MTKLVGFCTRSVNLIIYSHADTAKVASRREFSGRVTNVLIKNKKEKLSRNNAHHILKNLHIEGNTLKSNMSCIKRVFTKANFLINYSKLN